MMFGRKSKQQNQSDEMPKQSSKLRTPYPKPHVLLMDTDLQIGEKLREEGFDISEGTFGHSYKVPKQLNTYLPLQSDHNFPPNLSEKEIIVVDLQNQKPLPEPTGSEMNDADGNPIWFSGTYGIANPIPIIMYRTQSVFEKIYNNGAVFIVFAAPKFSVLYTTLADYHRGQPPFELSSWDFLPDVSSSSFVAKYEDGEEISISDDLANSPITHLLRTHLNGAHFSCHLKVFGTLNAQWLPLLLNKHGDTVGGAAFSDNGKGIVFVFPEFSDKAEFLKEFLISVLPSMRPDIFPYFQGEGWSRGPEYELTEVLKLTAEIKTIEEQAATQIASLRKRIEEERQAKWYLHALITETGDTLVSAVKKSLEVLGFNSVVDIDQEQQGSNIKREDLQIRDQSPLVLIEVKGVGGVVKDADALEIVKYIPIRMRELSDPTIRGISIINHQRNLPPPKRIENPFSEVILDSANHIHFGLMTTWTLYRLVRNFQKLGWKHEQIAQLFLRNGLIDCVPTHYELVGVVERFAEEKKVVGVRIESLELRLNDRIAFELPMEFEEQTIESLHLDGQPIEVASIGALVGIQTQFIKTQLKAGVRVFRVTPE
jgi:hypothetical protein